MDAEDRVLKNRRPLITEKIKLRRQADKSLLVDETGISYANNSAVEMTYVGYDSRHDDYNSRSMLNITEEPALGVIATNNTKISNSRSISKNK